MKITMLSDCLVPSMPMFLKGETYCLPDQLAHTLVERLQAVESKEEVKEEPKTIKSNKK